MKLIGALMVGGGFLGWVTYAFAGSGHAFLIASTLIILGVVILWFSKN